MKLSCLLIVLLFSSFSAFAENSGSSTDTSELTALFGSSEAGRLILVGFDDRSINRAPNISPLSVYRRRDNYRSTSWSRWTSEQIAEDYHLQKLTEWPMTEVGVQCVVYKVPTADAIAETFRLMAKDRRIKIVQKLNQFKTQGHQYNDPYFKLQSNLRSMQLDQVHDKTTGRNVTIGMIDTGVDIKHPDLSGQIIRQENFATVVSPSFSDDKHGTAVAGVMIARKDNRVGIAGVAPDAKLVALKACWPEKKDSMAAICNSYTLAQAVNMAIKLGVHILNMSLTGPEDPLLELLLNKAVDDGMIIVAADAGTSKEQANFPAIMEHVIPVQSVASHRVTLDNPLRLIEAPGKDVLTTLPHSTYDFISGSSIAAAEVSGLVALLLELNPHLNYQEIKSLLLQSESGLAEKALTFSGINAELAVAALCKNAKCSEERLSYVW